MLSGQASVVTAVGTGLLATGQLTVETWGGTAVYGELNMAMVMFPRTVAKALTYPRIWPDKHIPLHKI